MHHECFRKYVFINILLPGAFAENDSIVFHEIIMKIILKFFHFHESLVQLCSRRQPFLQVSCLNWYANQLFLANMAMIWFVTSAATSLYPPRNQYKCLHTPLAKQHLD